MAAEGMQSHDQLRGNCRTASHPGTKKGRINAPILPKPARCAKSDRLLGFLPSESKTEKAENDAPIRKSPAEPVRGGRAPRRASRRAEGRSGGTGGSPAA